MPRGRALRTLNVNPDTKQKTVDFKTRNSAFSCTENDITGNKLERSLKNAQLLKENKLVEEFEQEEQQAASASKLDPPSDSLENSESANTGRAEEPEGCDYLSPTELLCNSSGMCESTHTTAVVENAFEGSGSLASGSNNIVADLHEKLCSSTVQNKKRANRKRSQSSDTNDSLPPLKAIVTGVSSVDVDFAVPSTSFADTCNTRSSANRKKCKSCSKRTTPKWKKNQRKVNKDLALTPSIPTSVDNSSSTLDNTLVSYEYDSDVEVTAYVPCKSRRNIFSEAHSRNATNVCDQSVLELFHTSVPLVSEQNPEDANGTNGRLDSIINMLNDTVQRGDDDDDDDDDDDVLVIGTMPQTGVINNETTLNRSVVEIQATNVDRQLTPQDVIVISDDESEPSVTPALSKQLKPTAVGSQQSAASSSGRKWECPVCMEKLASVRSLCSTMCGHVFCTPCITNVLETTKNCPMCRKSLNKKKVHPLFFDGQ